MFGIPELKNAVISLPDLYLQLNTLNSSNHSMKTKIFITLLLCGCTAAMSATAEEAVMVVRGNTGNQEAIKLSTGTRIKFSTDMTTMNIQSGETDTPITVAIDDITSITFTLNSSIDTPAADVGGLRVSSQGSAVTITGAAAIEYLAADMKGCVLFAGRASERITLDFDNAPTGVYIIRANSTTFKFIKQ